MARSERSAGVIVFRRDPAPPHERLYLLLDYGRYWDYPKGHVEQGESDAEAALRELQEETGISDVALLPGFAHEISYFFRDRKHGLIQKTVIYFAGETRTSAVVISHEHVGFQFLRYADARQQLTYPNAREVLRMAEAFLTGLAKSAVTD